MDKFGLLAGIGRLPVEIARAARSMGLGVYAVALLDDVEQDLAQCTNALAKISVGQLNAIIHFFKEHQVDKVTMIGKVTKEVMFDGTAADARMRRLLSSLPDFSDDTVMLALVKELAGEGIQVFDQTQLIRPLLAVPGTLTKRQPDTREEADMEFGMRMAKEIGALDIGQTVVVKDMAVMAVEAIEGTDACIVRGGQLARGGAVVAKTAKPKQDQRFDMPTVGVETVRSMIEGGASALVMEAGKTLLVEKAKVAALADENNIAIVAR